eukprot:c20764_g1_i1 orf=300-794(+)
MIESFRKFRKRHLSNDPMITLFALGSCRKALAVEEAHEEGKGRTITRGLMKKDDDETKIGDDDGLSHAYLATNSDNETVLMRLPMEPPVTDHPIRCPHPEPCILQDGRALKERLPSLKRTGQLPFLTESEVQRLRWSRRAAPSDCRIYPAASAPETSLINLLQP